MDPLDPSQPGAMLIPYAPAAPFWSDGADKERWFAIPDGETITLDARGDFEFPAGSVTVKSFQLDGQLIETRLFVRHDDGSWAGYSYRWNEEQTEAFLLDGQELREVGDQTWICRAAPSAWPATRAPLAAASGSRCCSSAARGPTRAAWSPTSSTRSRTSASST